MHSNEVKLNHRTKVVAKTHLTISIDKEISTRKLFFKPLAF